MKHKTFFLLLLMLTTICWLSAQHAVWWDGSPPHGNTTRDHSIGYGNGFAWQVALGTATSWDEAQDVIAVSSGGYLVVGSNMYDDGSYLTHTDLVLYRLDEEGNLVWEKLFAIDNYKEMNEFKAVEKPDGGFLVAGKLSWGGVGVPRRCILLNCDANGDTLSTRKWIFADMATDDFKLIKSTFDESYLISYQRNYSGSYLTDVVKLDYNLDTVSIFVLPKYNFVPKPFGYIYRGSRYETISYYYLINFEGIVLDSFPDPHGIYNPSIDIRYIMQSLRNGSNVFFRIITTFPNVFKMATTTDTGEVLIFNDSCFSGDDIWWFRWVGGITPQEFSDGSICTPFNFYFDYYDNDAIGLVKLNSRGEHIGDTALTRYDGSMWLRKVIEGGDGRVLVFGRGENGPIGGMDIFIAKLETWNPVSVLTSNETGTLPLKVYPNPFSSHVNIQVQEGVPLSTPVEVSVRNPLGVLVWQGKLPVQPTLSVNLSTLNPGLYILTVRVNSRQMSKQILKH